MSGRYLPLAERDAAAANLLRYLCQRNPQTMTALLGEAALYAHGDLRGFAGAWQRYSIRNAEALAVALAVPP